MPIFTMLVGIPGSGKSTHAEEMKNNYENIIVCSSDAIREELSGDVNNQNINTEVFKVLHQRVRDNLKAGNNVIYDATNINRKRRMHFIREELKGIECTKVCVVFATPYEQCLKNNQLRERKIPEEVIKRMYMNWETPYYFEGWEQIHIEYYPINENSFQILDKYRECIDYNQKNSHHQLTLDQHMLKAYKHVKEDDSEVSFENGELHNATLFHDCGKPFTQVFHNAKGEPTEEAHYYNHENVGAYDCLCDKQRTLLTSILINLHMKPYTWKLEKTHLKYKRIWGESLYNMVMLLHEADVAAH